MSSPVVAYAPSFDFKNFGSFGSFDQTKFGPGNSEVQETVANLQAVIDEYASGAREIPAAYNALSEEEKVAKLDQLKSLLAGLEAKIPTPPQFTAPQLPIPHFAQAPQAPAIPAIPQPPKFDIEALKAQIPADFDFEKFKAENPDFDFEAVKAKYVGDAGKGVDFEAIKAKIASFQRPEASVKEVTIPRLPKDFDVAAIVEKAKALLEKNAGSFPEGFAIPDIPALPKGVSVKFEEESKLPAGVSPELIAKVRAMLAARKVEGAEDLQVPSTPAVPEIPEGPEAEAAIKKVKEILAGLADDASFTGLELPEKVAIVAAKFSEN